MRPYYSDDAVTIYHGDCREVASLTTDTVMVTDPPYGVTGHSWDSVVPPVEWMSGRTCVAFAAEPFATGLINNAPLPFHDDLVWVKNTASNHFNASRQPLRQHERILIFGAGDYCPVMVPRSLIEMARLNRDQRERYPSKFPGSVLTFPAVNNRNGDRTEHPSQKPVELLRWLVGSYAAPQDVVVDPFCGSGSTLVAARDLGRRAVGIEAEERYCEIAALRCAQEVLDVGEAA